MEQSGSVLGGGMGSGSGVRVGGWALGGGEVSWSRGLPLTHWLLLAPGCSGFRSVDHRLRLFLDVEVFSDSEEEFQCCIKVCATH